VPSHAPVRILLAEDNPADQRLISESLNFNGLTHTMHVVADGEQAVEVARVAGSEGQLPCPDVLILDLGLPKVDGLEVLRVFRNNENCTHTPVIVFSASVAPEHQLAVQNYAGVRFIAKPMDLDEFLEFGRTVKNLLVRAEGQG
jgi:two-component system response regulator